MLLLLSLMITSLTVAKPRRYEGFGSITKGGEGKPVYHVTSLKDDGSFGTLRDALSKDNRYIVFDTAGTILVTENLEIKGSHITIDGSTAPYPGITLKKTRPYNLVALLIRDANDIIIRHIRVHGLKDINDFVQEEAGTIAIHTSGTSSVKNIIIDHVTTRNAIDSGMDLYGEISNVTIQYCLIAYCRSPQTISHVSKHGFKKRRNISIHHNIYARNGERNPQLRADVRTVDYVNNIIYDWAYWDKKHGYGVRIKNKWTPNEPKVTINIINNAFIATNLPAWALVYGKDAGSEENDKGPDEILHQGMVYKESDMDSLYVSGNILPKQNMDNYSTVENPLAIPDYARVTTWPATVLADSVVPFAGTHYPLKDEQDILNAITDSLYSIFKYTDNQYLEISENNITISDIDGNIYPVVKIGRKWWTAENLKVTRYCNGDTLPNITDNREWRQVTSGAYCNYDNDERNAASYGRLYNWYAVNDSRNLAPAGWHVATDEDWKELEMYLGMNESQADDTYYRGTDEGGKLKKTGTSNWICPNTGATNQSGFSALPGGYRTYNGYFICMGYTASYWSSTESKKSNAWHRYLSYDCSGINHNHYFKQGAFSIRCVKD
jgi:uncharacterized protein (TIGR02145 family)